LKQVAKQILRLWKQAQVLKPERISAICGTTQDAAEKVDPERARGLKSARQIKNERFSGTAEEVAEKVRKADPSGAEETVSQPVSPLRGS
jgi:hypothetical protein